MFGIEEASMRKAYIILPVFEYYFVLGIKPITMYVLYDYLYRLFLTCYSTKTGKQG